jgi:hypothetical protein
MAKTPKTGTVQKSRTVAKRGNSAKGKGKVFGNPHNCSAWKKK